MTRHDMPSRHGLALRAVAGIGALLFGALFWVGEDRGLLADSDAVAAVTFTDAVQLTTDAGGSAMFTATNLAPGRQVVRCIAVTHTGAPGPVELRLHGSSQGSLATHLDMVVEAGAGGGHGDCNGFSGQQRYSGTLGAFVTTHPTAAEGLPVATSTASSGTTTFRFTVTLRSNAQAQGATTRAAFTWVAHGANVAVVPPPDPQVTASPTPQPTPPAAPDDPVPTEQPDPDAPAGPAAPSPASPAPEQPSTGRERAGAPAASPSQPADSDSGGATDEADPGVPDLGPDEDDGVPTTDHVPTDDDPPAAAPPSVASGGGGAPDQAGPPTEPVWRDRVARWMTNAVAAAVMVAEKTTFPLLLWLLVLVFLGIQDRIDRKDPKLALARVTTEPDLRFVAPPALKGRRP